MLLRLSIDEEIGWRKFFFSQNPVNSNGVSHKIKINDSSKHVLKLKQKKSEMTPKKLQPLEVSLFFFVFGPPYKMLRFQNPNLIFSDSVIKYLSKMV